MIVKILAFGIAKDILGHRPVELNLDDGSSADDLRAMLKTKYSALPEFMLAINAEYAQDDQIIRRRDEIAIIPPTNGG